jgi:hypothetical protein
MEKAMMKLKFTIPFTLILLGTAALAAIDIPAPTCSEESQCVVKAGKCFDTGPETSIGISGSTF